LVYVRNSIVPRAGVTRLGVTDVADTVSKGFTVQIGLYRLVQCNELGRFETMQEVPKQTNVEQAPGILPKGLLVGRVVQIHKVEKKDATPELVQEFECAWDADANVEDANALASI
jgi:hypothetical protein